MTSNVRYSRKKFHHPWQIVGLCVLIAVILVVLTFLGIYLAGYRYLRKTTEDGYIKFFGKVNDTFTAGTGTLYYSDGSSAKIDFTNSTITYDNGSVYEGTILELQRNGNGKMTFANGDVYEGSFLADEISGKGIYIYINGDVYVGEFVNGKKHGQGKYTFAADGSYYEGAFDNDTKHGEGTYVGADGSSYVGSYRYDLKHGHGTYVFENGDVYEGNFIDDIRSGSGKYTWAESGDTYEGEFYNNLMNGWGKYTWAAGRVYEGVFENGVIVRVEIPDTTTDPETTETTSPEEP